MVELKSAWKEFEIQSTDYLNKKFGEYATFIHMGGSNSRKSDIKAEKNGEEKFYVDAKHCPAQCGQFVLFGDEDSKKFIYSPKNVNPINEYAEMIIEHMNRKFDYFNSARTAGKSIEMENGSYIFSQWIIENYKKKNTRYFITNGFTILPVEKFSEYFDVTAKYRIKKSGPSPVGKSKSPKVLSYIEKNFEITSSRHDGKKLFVSSDTELHKTFFTLDDDKYMFSKRGNEYEIRNLSNTYNKNVIFSITLKDKKDGMIDSEFISALM